MKINENYLKTSTFVFISFIFFISFNFSIKFKTTLQRYDK